MSECLFDCANQVKPIFRNIAAMANSTKSVVRTAQTKRNDYHASNMRSSNCTSTLKSKVSNS